MIKSNRSAIRTQIGAFILLLTGYSFLASGATEQTQAQSVPQPDNIRYAVRFAAGSSTGGIQEAINDFGRAPACGTVVLPYGTVPAAATILVSRRQGCRIIGHGHGQNASLSPTAIKWIGAANGTVLCFADCVMCYATAFLIDGNHSAGKGLEYTSISGSSQSSVFEDLGVINIKGIPGQAIYVGSSAGRQVDTSTFRNITTNNSVDGIYQEGANTLQILYEEMNIQQVTRHFIDLEGGGLSTKDNTYLGPFTTSGVNLIQVANSAGYAFFMNDYFEGGAIGDTFFNMPGVLDSAGPIISIQNGSYSDSVPGNTWINYAQNGWLTVLGNRWSGAKALAFNFSPLGTVAHSRYATLSFMGNWYNNNPTFTFTQPYALTGSEPGVPVNSGSSSVSKPFVESFPDTNLQITAPSIYNAAGTQQTKVHIVRDTCRIGTNCSIILSGRAAFTSSTSYDCWVRDATTPTNAVAVTRTSGSAVAFTGIGGDFVSFICTGD